MPRRVSASEAKARFGAIVDDAIERGEDVIVESRGQPKVAIVPFQEYQQLAALREEARRREALARLERLREQVQARNRDLDAAQADALADRLSTQTVERMVAEGKVRYRRR